MSRRIILGLVALAVMTGVFAFGAHRTFADVRDFTLYNNSSYVTIVHVYVSPAYVDSWENDVLGQDVLFPGDYVNIHFNPRDGADTCIYDIRVDGDDGSVSYDWNVNLCSTSTVTFSD